MNCLALKIIEKNPKFGANILVKIGKSENFEKYSFDYIATVLPLLGNLKHIHDIVWSIDIDPTDM